jgi:hypothetical protein
MKKYERESLKIGKSSFAYAWVLDETGEERSRYENLYNFQYMLLLIIYIQFCIKFIGVLQWILQSPTLKPIIDGLHC